METEKRLVYAADVRREILYAEPRLAYIVNRVKTVDAVEVVRCKECKHFDEYTKKCYVFCHDCIEVQLEVDGDHFCSYGERRCDNEVD